MADHRYFEAWKRNPQAHTTQNKTASTLTKENSAATTSGNLLVRLDTPGGVTYSSDELSSHNIIKRLFIPYQLGDDVERKEATQEYDFDKDLKQEGVKIKSKEEPIKMGISAAQAYADSIDFDAIAEKHNKAQKEEKSSNAVDEDAEWGGYGLDKMSISGQSKASISSQMSTATLTTLSSSKKDGSLPDWFTNTSAHKDVVPFRVPPHLTNKPADYKKPWDAMQWRGHRAFERPSQREIENGIAAFDDVNGIGRAPSMAEAAEGRGEDDTKSVKTIQTTNTARQSARSLEVADLFVVDPRRYHTLRMVRRTDPRQVLLLCNGIYLDASQVATLKAAQAARAAGVDLKELINNKSKQVQDMISATLSSAKPQGGIGVVYCPHEDSLSQDQDALRDIDARIDINCAKRLEAPPEFTRSTARRAQLRAVLAAIELASWEEEGFDKVVIGVEQNWIVTGISNDIWRWKKNGWVNATGGIVEDRDLWELIDEAIMGYEKIDCNVRFWQVSPKDARLAKNLAEIGALKDIQRPKVVRWRRKKPTVLEEREIESRNHQGPTLLSMKS